MSDELVALLRGLLRPRTPKPGGAASRHRDPVGNGPATTFEALLQERLRVLEAELGEMRNRVNGLIFLVVGAVLTQLLLRLLP